MTLLANILRTLSDRPGEEVIELLDQLSPVALANIVSDLKANDPVAELARRLLIARVGEAEANILITPF